jgi:hypothetical protein
LTPGGDRGYRELIVHAMRTLTAGLWMLRIVMRPAGGVRPERRD